MKKVVNKGFTITVVSWENDGDNYNTISITVDDDQKARAYFDMMQLCKSKNSSYKGLGNTYGQFSEKQKNTIIDFMKSNPCLLDENIEDEDFLLDTFDDLKCSLLGSSENYRCRVMESCVITYSSEDIFVKEIKYK